MIRWIAPVFALTPLLAACGHDYAYVTAGPGAVGVAARYPFPVLQPEGEIFTTSFGFAEVQLDEQRPASLLHARVVAVNYGPNTWTIDAREQLFEVRGTPPIVPALVNTDLGGGPVYSVSPGQPRTFDLYFALGPSASDPREVSEFDLLWRVHVGAQSIGQCTPFERFKGGDGPQEPTPGPVFTHLGQQPNWWYGGKAAAVSRRPPVIRSYYYPPKRARTAPPPRASGPLLTQS
jgi:hypothetical protein